MLEVHHERGRHGDLLFDISHWHAVCRRCHLWINDHPDEARARGVLAQPGDWGRSE